MCIYCLRALLSGPEQTLPRLALDLVLLPLSGSVWRSETAAEVCAVPFRRNKWKLCFLLPSTINRHCVELVAGLWSKWILIHALLHEPRWLQRLSSGNEEDEREVLIKASISSVVMRSRGEDLE